MALVDKNSPIPAYHQIASDIIERISRSEWKIGDQLPSEAVLVKDYGVSRVTLRQALANLEERGLIERQQGRGAFLRVNPDPIVQNLNFPSIEYTNKITQKNESVILEWRIERSPSPYAQQMFGLNPDISYVFLSRLFVFQGKILGLNYAWFPQEMVPDIISKGLIDSSVTSTLKKRYNYHITRISNYIEAANAKAEEAKLLEIPYNLPVMKILSTHYLEDGRPVEYSSTLWVGTLTRFHLEVSEKDA